MESDTATQRVDSGGSDGAQLEPAASIGCVATAGAGSALYGYAPTPAAAAAATASEHAGVETCNLPGLPMDILALICASLSMRDRWGCEGAAQGLACMALAPAAMAVTACQHHHHR